MNIEKTEAKRVLIVQSDRSVAQALKDMVEVVAPNALVECLPRASWAQIQITAQQGDYQLVMSDQELSNQERGLDLFAFCKDRYPQILFVLLAAIVPGSLGDLAEKHINLPVFLNKSCAREECLALLRALLA